MTVGTSASNWHLAQLNVGRALEPLDSERLSGFVSQLDAINALADSAPGFVWRMQDDAGNAINILPTDDPQFITNLSVWTSLEALAEFVYRSAHTDVMRNRRQWFEVPTQAIAVLWWVPSGHIPTLDEALGRLDQLRRNGPTAQAFSFRDSFPAPDAVDQPSSSRDDWLCPA